MIRDLIGIPFERMGRTRAGADCVGLVLLAQREMGNHDAVDLWEYFVQQVSDGGTWEDVAGDWSTGGIPPPPGWAMVAEWPVPAVELRPGDVIEHDAKTALAHVSIVAEGGWMLLTGRKPGASYLIKHRDFFERCPRSHPSCVWRITPDRAHRAPAVRVMPEDAPGEPRAEEVQQP